jgi:hypothetical protein
MTFQEFLPPPSKPSPDLSLSLFNINVFKTPTVLPKWDWS